MWFHEWKSQITYCCHLAHRKFLEGRTGREGNEQEIKKEGGKGEEKRKKGLSFKLHINIFRNSK